MNRSLTSLVKSYIADRNKRIRLMILVCALSFLTVFAVYNALMRPAISMEKKNPLLTAEMTNAVFGDILTAQVTATADPKLEETIFYLAARTENAELAEDLQFEGEDDTAEVSTMDNGILTLHRVAAEGDDPDGYWFALQNGKSVSFELPYVSIASESGAVTSGNDSGEKKTLGEQTSEADSSGREESASGESTKEESSSVESSAVESPAEESSSELAEENSDAAVGEEKKIDEETSVGEDSFEKEESTESVQSVSLDTSQLAASSSVEPEQSEEEMESAFVQLYTAAGKSLKNVQATAEKAERRGKEPTLTLRWMTQKELDALPVLEKDLEIEFPEMPDGATSWATVEKLDSESKPTAQSFGIMAASLDVPDTAKEEGLPFTDYVKTAVVSKLENGQWKEATTFENGDTVKVSIGYELPTNFVGTANKTITYQLPDGVVPANTENGMVYDGNTTVGAYTITSEGLITIVFNDSFADDKRFSGTVQFQGTVSITGDGTESEVKFGGSGTTITIKQPEKKTDLSISKTGKYNTAAGKIEYTVTASSTQGTKDTVTIIDSFQSGNTMADYDTGSFTVVKISNGGSKITVSSPKPVVSGASFTIAGLPALGEGERYEVTYAATPGTTTDSNGASSVNNSAKGSSGNTTKETWNSVTISGPMLQKTGSYNYASGKINWTITINGSKKDINGYTLKDTLTADGKTINLPGKVTLKDSSGKEIQVSLPYTFPAGSKDTYTIIYSTEAPGGAPGTITTVKNQAVIEKSGNPSYGTETEVGVPHKDYGVSKRYSGQQAKDGSVVANWTAEMTVPEGTPELSKLMYTDTIPNVIVDGAEINNSHYTTAALLGGITATLSDGTPLVRGTDYRIRDFNGQVITSLTDTTVLHGFQVEFLAASQPKLGSKTIMLNYATYMDYSSITPGASYTFYNKGAIPDHDSKADFTYTAPKRLEKQASLTGKDATYKSGALETDLTANSGILYYRLLLKLDNSVGDSITVTDILPEGAALVDGTNGVMAMLYGNDWWQKSEFDLNYSSGGKTYRFQDHVKAQLLDNSKTLKITIDDINGIRNNNIGMGSNPTVAVYYKLSVAKDTYWDDLTHKNKTYVNTASWNGNTDGHSTTVNREVPPLAKAGEQLPQFDSSGNVMKDGNGDPMWSNTIRYTLIINPAGQNLAEGADTITLKDVLSASNVSAMFQPDSVKLYRYDAAAQSNLGAEISRDQYSYLYDDLTNQLTFTLPDSTACILVYDYLFDRGTVAGGIEISNSATLSGSINTGSNNKTVLNDSSSSATASKRKITVYKVDSADYGKLIAGAEFKLEQYTKVSNQWNWQLVDKGEYTTDANGKIAMSFLDDNGVDFSNNILYRLTETKAPTGYQKSDAPYYFVWMADGKTKAETVNSMTQTGLGGISDASIRFVSSGDAAIYVPNDYTRFSVKKLWQNDEGKPLENPPVKSVKFSLLRQARQVDGYTVTVSVESKSGSFSASQVVAKNSPLTIAINAWWPDVYDVTIGGTITTVRQNNGKAVLANLSSVTSDMSINVNLVKYNVYVSALPFEFSGYKNATTNTAAGEPETVRTFELSEENGWEWSAEDLDRADKNGNLYYYWVEEDTPSGNKVSYLNNGGIRTGTVTAINTVIAFELPSTGGVGIAPLYLLGTILMAAPIILLLRKRKRPERGSR